MTRMITALYNSRSDAEAAQRDIEALGLTSGDVRIVDQDSAYGMSGTGTDSTHDRGMWESIKDFFSGDDAPAYAEGLRRGHYLLTAHVDDDRADRVIDALDSSDAIDVDSKTTEWRAEGWSGAATAAPTAAPTDLGTEDSIPIVEEQLVVGKREVDRGGVRVRSYVRDIPVSEQVRLREEHVKVERRPVDRALDAADLGADAFRERSIEVSETAEEAVVGKQARVVEEVVVRKSSEEHVERIDDTVRRTEVEIDRTGSGTGFANDDELEDRLVAGRTAGDSELFGEDGKRSTDRLS